MSEESGAVFSYDGVYRYHLWRRWDNGHTLNFVMLNPSTADDVSDDPTIRRCIGFAKRDGFGAISVTNLYAMRTTRPIHLRDISDPEGPDNLGWAQKSEGPIICAWGAGAIMKGVPRSRVLQWLTTRAKYGNDVGCLGTTAAGHPRHPLYLKNDTYIQSWKP